MLTELEEKAKEELLQEQEDLYEMDLAAFVQEVAPIDDCIGWVHSKNRYNEDILAQNQKNVLLQNQQHPTEQQQQNDTLSHFFTAERNMSLQESAAHNAVILNYDRRLLSAASNAKIKKKSKKIVSKESMLSQDFFNKDTFSILYGSALSAATTTAHSTHYSSSNRASIQNKAHNLASPQSFFSNGTPVAPTFVQRDQSDYKRYKLRMKALQQRNFAFACEPPPEAEFQATESQDNLPSKVILELADAQKWQQPVWLANRSTFFKNRASLASPLRKNKKITQIVLLDRSRLCSCHTNASRHINNDLPSEKFLHINKLYTEDANYLEATSKLLDTAISKATQTQKNVKTQKFVQGNTSVDTKNAITPTIQQPRGLAPAEGKTFLNISQVRLQDAAARQQKPVHQERSNTAIGQKRSQTIKQQKPRPKTALNTSHTETLQKQEPQRQSVTIDLRASSTTQAKTAATATTTLTEGNYHLEKFNQKSKYFHYQRFYPRCKITGLQRTSRQRSQLSISPKQGSRLYTIEY